MRFDNIRHLLRTRPHHMNELARLFPGAGSGTPSPNASFDLSNDVSEFFCFVFVFFFFFLSSLLSPLVARLARRLPSPPCSSFQSLFGTPASAQSPASAALRYRFQTARRAKTFGPLQPVCATKRRRRGKLVRCSEKGHSIIVVLVSSQFSFAEARNPLELRFWETTQNSMWKTTTSRPRCPKCQCFPK